MPQHAEQVTQLSPATPSELFEALTIGWTSATPDPRTGQPVSIPALIPALHEAIFGGMESTGGGTSGFASKMPIDSAALDLYEVIEQEIAEAWAFVFPQQIPGIQPTAQLLSQVFAVTQRNPEGELVTTMRTVQRVEHAGTRWERWWVEREPVEHTPLELLQRWVDQIRNFFDPPRRREIIAPCVACGEEWAWKHVDGESKPYRVLVFEQDVDGNTLGAQCLACKSWWGISQMRDLAEKIGAALRAKAAHEQTTS